MPLNIKRLDDRPDPSKALGKVGEVGNFHIQKSQEFMEREVEFGRSLGASALSAIRMSTLMIDEAE